MRTWVIEFYDFNSKVENTCIVKTDNIKIQDALDKFRTMYKLNPVYKIDLLIGQNQEVLI